MNPGSRAPSTPVCPVLPRHRAGPALRRRWRALGAGMLPLLWGACGPGPDPSLGLRGTWWGRQEVHSTGTSETSGSAPVVLPQVTLQRDHTFTVEDHVGGFSSEDGTLLAVVTGVPCAPLEVHGTPHSLSTRRVSCVDQTLDPAGTLTVVKTHVDRFVLERTGPRTVRILADLRVDEDRTSSEGVALFKRREHTTLSMDAERL